MTTQEVGRRLSLLVLGLGLLASLGILGLLGLLGLLLFEIKKEET